jgi:hypothetical protein
MLKYQLFNNISTIGNDSTNTNNDVSSGNIYITNVTWSDIVSDHEYLPDTSPANQILTAVMTDSDVVTVHFIAEPSIS